MRNSCWLIALTSASIDALKSKGHSPDLSSPNCSPVPISSHLARTKSTIHWCDTSLRYWQTRTHCCEHIVADTNVSPFAHASNICCGHKFGVRDTKMFLILFKNILCPQQMFPSLRGPGNVMSNNVSATMCPRLPPPLNIILGWFILA